MAVIYLPNKTETQKVFGKWSWNFAEAYIRICGLQIFNKIELESVSLFLVLADPPTYVRDHGAGTYSSEYNNYT